MSTTPIDFSKYEEKSAPTIDFSKYVAPQPKTKGFMDALAEGLPSGSDLLHAVGLPGNSQEFDEMGRKEASKTFSQRLLDNMAPVIAGPGGGMVVKTIGSMAKEGGRAIAHPLDPMAPIHAVVSQIPFAAPVIDQMTQQGLGTPQANATGITNAAILGGGLVAPKVIPPALKTAGKVAGVVSDAIDPDITGLISPRLAHLQRLAGKVSKVAGKLTPEEAMEPPPFPGAQEASNPTVIFRDVPNLSVKGGPMPPKNILDMPKPIQKGYQGEFEVNPGENLSATPIQDALERPATAEPQSKSNNLTDSGNKQKSNLTKNQKQLAAFRQKNMEQPDFPGTMKSTAADSGYKVQVDEAAPMNFTKGEVPGYATLNTVKNGQSIGRMDVGANHYAGVDNALEIKNVRIPPELQGKGHGTVMYEDAAKYAKSNGADAVISDVKREPAAEGMWKSLQRKYPDKVSYDGSRWIWRLAQ